MVYSVAVLALYCNVEGVPRPGGVVSAHVSTTASRFHLELHPFHSPGAVAWRSELYEGVAASAGAPDVDWQWPAYPVHLPDEADLYILVGVGQMEGPSSSAPHLIGYDGTALLAVVATQPRHPALYKLPMRTYQAYNPAGGASLYVESRRHGGDLAVGLLRPGAGIGGPSAEAADVYGFGSPRQTFWHWDAPFLRWARESGYRFDIAFDTHLDADAGLLEGYRAIVSAGHDEYWTAQSRRVVSTHVERGGAVAVFGANTCWWRAEVTDTIMRVAKDRDDQATGPGLWWRTGAGEETLLGLSYRNGGGWWGGARPSTRYEVHRPDDPLLAGVDLHELRTLTHLAGYEVDGPVPLSTAELTVLAHATLRDEQHAGWDVPQREFTNTARPAATMAYQRAGAGLIFNAGTTDWARHLHYRSVDRITRNVLDNIGTRS